MPGEYRFETRFADHRLYGRACRRVAAEYMPLVRTETPLMRQRRWRARLGRVGLLLAATLLILLP
ncbi:MAG: hypothetical protein SNJ79_05920 [Sphingomonadaceae bacterium]